MDNLSKPNRIFLLSPASCGGRRAEILLRKEADFDLAFRLRSQGVALGEAFSFLSGLYFRGKMAYAARFGRTEQGLPTSLVITAGRGLLAPETAIHCEDLQAFATTPIDLREASYREPLRRDALNLATKLVSNCQVVLLGSIATPKYREVLVDVFGDHLYFPAEFIGRGDMSRGGLMLRCVDAGRELDYVPVSGATVRGSRPERLKPRSKSE
jgi:hypothetical protein